MVEIIRGGNHSTNSCDGMVRERTPTDSGLLKHWILVQGLHRVLIENLKLKREKSKLSFGRDSQAEALMFLRKVLIEFWSRFSVWDVKISVRTEDFVRDSPTKVLQWKAKIDFWSVEISLNWVICVNKFCLISSKILKLKRWHYSEKSTFSCFMNFLV